jgi:NAD(P)-dependent dehydrogenase (short-subunit alcohol dehydrogenase family)
MSHHRPVAVVTGAGSGIGRAVALALAQAGYAVALAGRRPEALAQTVAAGPDPEAMICQATDVADPLAVRALFEAAVARWGRVDLLFNNAGVTAPALPLDELPAAQLIALVNVNLIGALLCAREAMRVMKVQTPQGGRIINNGSVSAYAPRPNSAPYTATKHGITGLTKSILLDGRAFQISASQIDIGNAVTDMSAHMDTGAIQANGSVAPEPRMDVGHVARTVVHMAQLPPEANIAFVTLMATNMPLYGRG